MKKNILMSGGTGLIGTELTKQLLARGYSVTILTRANKASIQGVTYARWDLEKESIDKDAIRNADYIIHLAGAGVADKRWTAARKKEIAESRTKSSALLVKAINENPNQINAVVSASAIGWYGSDQKGSKLAFTETDPPATDFLGATCEAWEKHIQPVKDAGKRLVLLRTGIVLSNQGGALQEFSKPVKFGIASVLGAGKQIVSWIHIDDLCRMYIKAIEDIEMKGVYNAVAPKPVSNHQLVSTLAGKMKGKFYITFHVPAPILKLALGEMSTEVLKSATVSSRKIQSAGFQFQFPSIESALDHLVKHPQK